MKINDNDDDHTGNNNISNTITTTIVILILILILITITITITMAMMRMGILIIIILYTYNTFMIWFSSICYTCFFHVLHLSRCDTLSVYSLLLNYDDKNSIWTFPIILSPGHGNISHLSVSSSLCILIINWAMS